MEYKRNVKRLKMYYFFADKSTVIRNGGLFFGDVCSRKDPRACSRLAAG